MLDLLAMLQVIFDIDGCLTPLPSGDATLVGERLRCYAAGAYGQDVEELARSGTDPGWVAGARAMADAIEDVLTETRPAPIPLDREGRAANALAQALRLTPGGSGDATGAVARLHAALTHAD
jgi:hypothetical protein